MVVQDRDPKLYPVSTTPQGRLQPGTKLYSDTAKAQNQAGILNRSIIVDNETGSRSPCMRPSSDPPK